MAQQAALAHHQQVPKPERANNISPVGTRLLRRPHRYLVSRNRQIRFQRPTTTAGSSDFEKLLERVHSCTQVTVPLAQRPQRGLVENLSQVQISHQTAGRRYRDRFSRQQIRKGDERSVTHFFLARYCWL